MHCVLSQVLRILLLLCIVFLAGCRGNSSSFHFYSLYPPEQAVSPVSSVAVGIGPLDLPLVIDRPQLVVRTSENTVKLLEFHRWAGPLHDEILKSIVSNMKVFVKSDRIVPHPWERFIEPDYTVPIRIQRFDGTLGEHVVLIATFGIVKRGEETARIIKTVYYKEPTGENSYAAFIAAHDKILQDFCKDMAKALAQAGAKEDAFDLSS